MTFIGGPVAKLLRKGNAAKAAVLRRPSEMKASHIPVPKRTLGKLIKWFRGNVTE